MHHVVRGGPSQLGSWGTLTLGPFPEKRVVRKTTFTDKRKDPELR